MGGNTNFVLTEDSDMEDYLFEDMDQTTDTLIPAMALYMSDKMKNEQTHKHGGSVMGRQTIDRHPKEGNLLLLADYFDEKPVYNNTIFRRRYRMRKSLFLRISDSVAQHDSYFVQKKNAAGTIGLSTLQKTTAAMRQLALGVGSDALDEYIRMGASTARQCMKKFCRAVVEVFGQEYLRQPNQKDIDAILAENEKRAFPGCLGSIDTTKWFWSACPKAWQGHFTGREQKPSLILEAVATHDLWIWHAFFGLPGSLNDINVLDRSSLLDRVTDGTGPEVKFIVNGKKHDMGYYLADGIYPDYPVFVKTISDPQSEMKKNFAAAQESARKDIERAFGVLKSRFAILNIPARLRKIKDLNYIMMACIIMHNMIVEDERGKDLGYEYDSSQTVVEDGYRYTDVEMSDFIKRLLAVKNKKSHYQLRNDLIAHQWNLRGQQKKNFFAKKKRDKRLIKK